MLAVPLRDPAELERQRLIQERRNLEINAWQLMQNHGYTLEKIRASQPDPFAALYRGVKLQAALPPSQRPQGTTSQSRQSRAVTAQGSLLTERTLDDRKHSNVDKETGEIHDIECERRKDRRRAIIINSKHGGRNGATDYRPHGEPC